MVLVILCSTALQCFPSSFTWVSFMSSPNMFTECPVIIKCFSTFATVVRTLIMLAPHMINKVISSHNMLTRFFTFATVVKKLWTLIMLAIPIWSTKLSLLSKSCSHISPLSSLFVCSCLIYRNKYFYLGKHFKTTWDSYTKINYSTVICARRFDSSDNLNDHMRNKHYQSSYNCDECEETFEDTQWTCWESSWRIWGDYKFFIN